MLNCCLGPAWAAPEEAEARARRPPRPLPPRAPAARPRGLRRGGEAGAPHAALPAPSAGEAPAGAVLLSRKPGCPSAELSPPELAVFHWTKCREERRPRGGEGAGSATPRLRQLSLRASTFTFNGADSVGLPSRICSSGTEQRALASPARPGRRSPASGPRHLPRSPPPGPYFQVFPADPRVAAPLAVPSSGSGPAAAPPPSTLRAPPAPGTPSRSRSPAPAPAVAIFFLFAASLVVYPAGGCDVRDAQQQKITTSSSATSWTLSRALFIYLFREARGGGAAGVGAGWAPAAEPPGCGGGSRPGDRGPGVPRGRGGRARRRGQAGAPRPGPPAPPARAVLGEASPERRNLLLFIVWRLHAVLAAARPSPASACVRACVCAGCARGREWARAGKGPKTP